MYRSALRHDWRNLRRDPGTRLAITLLLLLLVLAVWNAFGVVREHRAGIARFAEDVAVRQSRTVGEVPIPAIRGAAMLPDGPLSGLTLGRTRIDPATGEFTLTSRADQLFRNYQTTSPSLLPVGEYDLAFVVVLLLPLFLIVLGHDMLAADRDAGRLRLLLASGVRPLELVAARTTIRAAVVMVPVVAAALTSALAVDGGAFSAWGALTAWLAVALAYQALWWGVVVLVATVHAQARTLAAGLLALWALMTLLLPALAAAGVGIIVPTPSRLAFDADIRRAQTEVLANFPRFEARFGAAAYRASVGPPILKRQLLARRVVDDAFASRWAAFDIAARRRARLVDAAGVLLPALAIDRELSAIAGTGEARRLAFRESAVAWERREQHHLTDRFWTGMTAPAAAGRLWFVPALSPAILPLGTVLIWIAATLLFLMLAVRRLRTYLE